MVGGRYTDIEGASGGWRWNAASGVVGIPGMSFATGVSGDGRTVVGGTDPFAEPPLPIADFLVVADGRTVVERGCVKQALQRRTSFAFPEAA